MNNIVISIVMPALNEEKNIKNAITNTIMALKDYNIKGEIIVVNDGSTDGTKSIVEQLMKKYDCVKMITHDSPKGIGGSFWDGVDNAKGELVSMFPGDNENDPWEIFRYINLLEHVDIIIPFVYNRQVRSIFRNGLSFVYRFIINTTFLVYLNYTNGTVIYRRSIIKGLPTRRPGFFFQTDILIRLLKQGYLFAEVPYRLGLRGKGVSKAVSFPSLIQVVRGYFRLMVDHHFKENKDESNFLEDSITARRYEGSEENSNKMEN